MKLIETFVPTNQVSVIYMYYDCKIVDGKLRPVILDSEDYNEEFKNFVLDPIID